MAKAQFHKSQRVFVKPVGTWALVEQVIPHWVKDVDEPLRISYECGLGRQFQAHELTAEQNLTDKPSRLSQDEDDLLVEQWQIVRRKAKWRARLGEVSLSEVGSYPVIVTDEDDIGGWRVSGSEYDRDPARIEHQARMIACTPDLLRVVRKFSEYVAEHPDECPVELKPVMQRCASILRFIYQVTDEDTATPSFVAAE
ncbi:MAG: hypothetical protein GYB49_07005 [Alphaproteobacteria bacterium]|jgi:hypothetical protein|nr:hypothetical protein [Hyphomonas sp.]MBR9806951.1 hypothetical protein [Alphaproteobacteria bacterium]|tara:strand:- start:4544 stop:5137 length:594 start_codon:yes stop_codon:yes gene_type:complete